jgi:hypothetical protein
MRWSGRNGDASRKVFAGPEEKARVKFAKLHADMRRGAVELKRVGRDCGIMHRAHGGCHGQGRFALAALVDLL